MRKRIIDLLGKGPPPGTDVYHLPLGAMPPRTFQCRACGWSITEEPAIMTKDKENVKMLRWMCDECGGNCTNAPAGIIPEGWDVDDVDDLETCRAVCPECVKKGLSA